MKILTIKTIIALVILFTASCSKEGAGNVASMPAPEPAPAPVDITLPGVMTRKDVEPGEVFALKRDGQKVAVQILIDFSTCSSIEIARNTTGSVRNRYWAAELKPQTRHYEDVLPDAQAHWYWVRATPAKGSPKTFGPLRAEPDTENKGVYEDVATVYFWKVSRTTSTAAINWKFPEAKYQSIKIYRNTKRDTQKRKTVLDTREWIGSTKDRLPDADADYWYWITAHLETGAVITHGPTKAEFTGQ